MQTQEQIFSLDVETACNVRGCQDKQCDHALMPHRGRITCVGVHNGERGQVFRDFLELRIWLLENPQAVFVGHNLKFDLKFLARHGVEIAPERWAHDTALMATASYKKIPDSWLETYEVRRKALDKELPKGYSRRKAGKHSLKCLAPYHLGVEPFWEDPSNHDSDEYVLKDCLYTFRLWQFFEEELRKQGTYDFYQNHLMDWAKNYLDAEIAGVGLDVDLLSRKEEDVRKECEAARAALDVQWCEARQAWEAKQRTDLHIHYGNLAYAAVERLKQPTQAKIAATHARYGELERNAAESIEPFNPDSPKQMAWLLKDHLGLDITIEKWDKKIRQRVVKDSTGVDVIKILLAKNPREDLRQLLKYRKAQKLLTSFFLTYRELQEGGTLYCNFNLDVTKTGRTSSDKPNLQQVPGHLHDLFVAPPDWVFITKDLEGIEPAVIAYYSEDPVLCEILLRGGNFHSYCAKLWFGLQEEEARIKGLYPTERKAAKRGDLAAFYGTQYRKLRYSMLTEGFNWSEEHARQVLREYRETFRGVFEFKETLDRMAEQGPIRNFFGRKRSFVGNRSDIFMQNFNSLSQNTASDLCLDGINETLKECRRREISARIAITVHDEGVIACPAVHAEEVDAIYTEKMTRHELLTKFGRIPLKVEGKIARSWSK